MIVLIVLLVLLLAGGGWTARPGYAGPAEVGGFVWLLVAVVVIVLVVRLLVGVL